ncbi:MAG: prephenate dehydrogenase [Oscillospiraceae bacterium]|nr:prephenate dehydrogenase [Oscillospiraceae bacterium]
MNIFIVGLGLIGGSLAKSLKGFKNAEIYGINRTRRYLDSAEKEGVIKKGYTVDEAEAIKEADIIILCLYPSLNVEFIKKTGEYLKQGAVITDVSGVKTYIEEEMAKILPPGVDFVGGHPMAGREVTSYENSSADLFENTSYLVVPSKTSKEENVRLIEEMARYAGASRVVRTNAENHDEIIAYTSQLMHVVAAAICNIPTAEKAEGYAGGSIRDATRVANINETLWSELFLENAPALINAIDNMQAALGDFRSAIEKGDRK